MKPLLTIILFVIGFTDSFGQDPSLENTIHKDILSHCAVCLKRTIDSTVYLQPGLFTSSVTDYHNCHLFYTNNKLDSAYKYALQVLNEINNKGDSTKLICAVYIEAKVLIRRQLYRESLDLYLQLLKSDYAEKEFKIDAYISAGAIYLIKGEYSRALETLTECLNRYDVTDNTDLKKIYTNIAASYLLLKNIKESEVYFQKSIDISKSLRDTVAIAMAYMGIANQYYEQYKDAEAERYFRKCLQLALMTKNMQLKQNAYLNMAVVAENKKDYPFAIIYRKKYEALHDSLYDRDNVWSLSQEQKKLDSVQHIQKEELLRQKNLLQESELTKRNLQRNAFIGLAIMFLLFFVSAFYAYRQKKQQNIIITAQREELDALNHAKDQLFSVVAHDLRSPVQTLRATMNTLRTALHDKNIPQAEQVAGEIECISNGTYSLLNNLLYWALSQTGQLHFAKEKLNARKLAEHVLYDYAPAAGAKHITVENQVSETLYCIGDMNTIKIMLRNLVDNAIKFSEPFATVIVSGTYINEECIISIVNTGKEIDDAIVKALDNKRTKRVESSQGKSTGIGLWLVRTMAEYNGGRVHIQSQDKEIKISIYLPHYEHHEQTSNTYC